MGDPAYRTAMKKKTTAKLEEAWPAAATSIGARVRAFRRERKFSVAELALRAGVSTGIVSQIERDIANPSVRMVLLNNCSPPGRPVMSCSS